MSLTMIRSKKPRPLLLNSTMILFTGGRSVLGEGNETVMGWLFIRTLIGFTRVSGSMIRDMGMGTRCTLMGAGTMAITQMGNQRARDCTLGLMGNYMKASGNKGLNMATGSGRERLATRILDNGSIVKHRGMVSMYGRTEINMKVNGSRIWGMVTEVISSIMATSM